MGKKYPEINDKHAAFVAEQQMYFVATAPNEGRINLSPKGIDSLRIMDGNRVVWLNLTGSGNETAAHLLEDDRMTLMFCAFQGNPKILRFYGQAHSIHPRDSEWEELIKLFPESDGARQIIDMQVDLVHTSCGFGVPLYDYVGQREELPVWIEKKGPEGINQYWHDRNLESMDGKPTGIFD